MMLGNLQQAETLLDNLKKEKTGYRQVVEMKEKKRAPDKCCCLCRIARQNRIKKKPTTGKTIWDTWNKWNAKPLGELRSSFRGIAAE